MTDRAPHINKSVPGHAAIRGSARAPERWKYVPEAITEAMIEEWQGECAGDADEASPQRIRKAWTKALAATPSPPALSGEDHVAEFGEYLAKAAEFYVQTVDPIISDAADPDITTDAHRALRSAIYEFRKRAAKAASLIERQGREIAELKRAMRAMHEDENDRAPGGGPP